MNTKIGILFLAILISMVGIAVPSMAGKDKLDPDPAVGGYINCHDCIGIENLWVYNMDINGTSDGWWNGSIPEGGWNFWKTTNTNCKSPQCEKDAEGDNNLVGDSSVDFSEYPAQQDCISIEGNPGRLPTKEELAIIYKNRANLGNNFAHMYYWSSTEYNSTGYNDEMAYYQAFRSGRQSWAKKDTARYIRCVRDAPPI